MPFYAIFYCVHFHCTTAFHLTWLSTRVCITKKLFKFCSRCCEEQKIGLSLLKLHEFMDPFTTFSKLCYIVADLGKLKEIQLILIPGGALPYVGYTGMCCSTGYGFRLSESGTGYTNHRSSTGCPVTKL